LRQCISPLVCRFASFAATRICPVHSGLWQAVRSVDLWVHGLVQFCVDLCSWPSSKVFMVEHHKIEKFEQSMSIHLRMTSLGLHAGLAAHLQIRNRMEFHHVPL
jgi:hypothetical protein